jgi:ParB family chromosome partitioning protein
MSDDAPRPARRPSGLGRGLSALMGDVAREQPVHGTPSAGVQTVPVASLRPHPGQPRRHFDDAALDELAASIAARGLIQPILVRAHAGGYQIVAGERRWRAAQRARLHEVPVIVREFDESETLEVALIENVQREDLNAIEEAVANLLRLLELPATVRDAVADKRLSMGHARALITAADPETLAAEVIRRGLSVRETEKLARGAKPGPARPGPVELKGADADIASLQRQLSDMTGLKVQIAHGANGGSVTLAYSSLDQLDMICQRLSGEPI